MRSSQEAYSPLHGNFRTNSWLCCKAPWVPHQGTTLTEGEDGTITGRSLPVRLTSLSTVTQYHALDQQGYGGPNKCPRSLHGWQKMMCLPEEDVSSGIKPKPGVASPGPTG
ncbi:unnamed protein product [Rangifer tarandus platyrhynchus]|uniref:Uncharacterized protein n=2 Tax=Rangifer tarandus platyrhynchus TaxID=3082113 RepID=A0AC59YI31_RANTA|nr:unnamed protein product [Rangifer tarandus platyrhynchus]